MSKNNSEAIIFIDENVSSKTVHLETFKEVLQWTIIIIKAKSSRVRCTLRSN